MVSRVFNESSAALRLVMPRQPISFSGHDCGLDLREQLRVPRAGAIARHP